VNESTVQTTFGGRTPSSQLPATDTKDAMIAKPRTTKALRTIVFALAVALLGAGSITSSSAAQAQTVLPAATGVIVILTVKPGVTREQVMAVMPAEIRATVQLYLNGKIREWYSRGDGRGVVFLLDTSDVATAQAIMEGLPLGKANLMDHEYIAVGPLVPLGLLMTGSAPRP
jgi:hypothetical protein